MKKICVFERESIFDMVDSGCAAAISFHKLEIANIAPIPKKDIGSENKPDMIPNKIPIIRIPDALLLNICSAPSVMVGGISSVFCTYFAILISGFNFVLRF